VDNERSVVFKDDAGNYHIDHHGNDGTIRSDIHGSMDKTAYINWLSNALFNASYENANKAERKWLFDA
jgi:hypothetical protein